LRLKRHNSSKSGYTSTKKPWKLVYCESLETKKEAFQREKYIKAQKSKKFIELLMA
jgi:putative endonuclease